MPNLTGYYAKPDPPACRDCGGQGLGWWRDRPGYGSSGVSFNRCRACYNAYNLAGYYRRRVAGPRPPRPARAAQERVFGPFPAICAGCGCQFLGRQRRSRWCTKRCAERHRRGFVNGRQVVCESCGHDFPAKRGGRNTNRFCSMACYGESQRRTEPRLAMPPTSCPVAFRRCQRCDGLMIARMGRTYCSEACRYQTHCDKTSTRAMRLYRAAFETGQVKEAMHWRVVLVSYLADRDGPKCALCGKNVDLTIRSGTRGSDAGSSVDHIVPYSKGGSDELSNLRLTHWGCNRRRGNRGTDEQLRLAV